MKVAEQDYLEHVGTPQTYDFDPHGSGRYRQGSGEHPLQHPKEFQERVASLRKQARDRGYTITDKELCGYLFGMKDDGETPNVSIREFRKLVTQAKAKVESEDYLEAHKLKEDGWSYKAIGDKLGRSESGVRQLLQRDADAKSKRINNTADLLRESLETKGGFIDIGAGSELLAGVGRSNFDAAVKQLESEGYVVVPLSIRQMFGQGNTTLKVLAPAGTTKKDVYDNLDQLRSPVDVHLDKDGNKPTLRPIENVKSSRVMIKYAEEGGIDKDGVIELRRGVADLDLGNAKYAQVRIGVDGTHYLKGMAVYADDLPDGIDIRFNTNKHVGTPMMDVLKGMQDPKNKMNPFGASIVSQRGALNIVNEEGDWAKWSKTLSSQFLSKQYEQTAKRQLKATADIAQAEFEEIKSLTNPTLKRYLLQQFANSCDSDAVHLKAVRLPGQTQKVLLPLPEGKPDQCYCPSLPDGTQVALVRYPHGGVFEIPTLTVNNSNKTAKRVFGNAMDAIGIHPSQASVLSGADFDGDTVMVLPLNGLKIKHSDPLPGLKDFEPKTQFNGAHLADKDKMKKGSVQMQMGMISNLITDMTIQGADNKELARAVAHSMVVIDAYKHGLDYKASEKYFNIAELKAKYQPEGGASTLISRAKSQTRYYDRREKAVSKLTPEERERWEKGEIIYEPTGKTVYSKKKGDYVLAQTKGTKMGEAKDAYELSSGSPMESYYADYANRMKALANAARAEMRATGKLEYSPSANKTYSAEVASLKNKLKTAQMNAPLERKAQALANSTLRVERADHPEYDEGQLKKAKSRHLEAARAATGAGKEQIKITAKEWDAIQSGAIHDSMLLKILDNTDSKEVRRLAMPRGTTMSTAKVSRARQLLKNGHTWADVAEILGVSQSTLQNALND